MNPSERKNEKNKTIWIKIKPGCKLPKVNNAPLCYRAFNAWGMTDSGNGISNAFANSVFLKVDKAIMRGQLIKREASNAPKWLIEGVAPVDIDMFDYWAPGAEQ